MSAFPEYLGTCAIDNLPLSAERGFYHVAGRGWYVVFDRTHHGPFDMANEALRCYSLTMGKQTRRVPWRLVRYYLKIAGQAIIGTILGLAFFAGLMLL